MKKMRITAMILAVGMIATGLSGCGESKSTGNAGLTGVEPMTESVLPISDEEITLTIWMKNESQGYVKSYNDMKVFDELAKRTGVKLEFIHPTGGASEQLNVMLASGDYPDLIFSKWDETLASVYQNGVAIRLNEYIDTYAPNLKKLLEENDDYRRQLELPEGDIAMMPRLLDDEEFLCFDGYFIRKDWLDKLNMDVPETLEDWHQYLLGVKNNDMNGNGDPNDEVPFASLAYMYSTGLVFSSAYGAKPAFQRDVNTGKITHGVLLPEFKEWVDTMRQWYGEGLIDVNFLNAATTDLDSMMLNDQLGALYIDNNNSIPKYQELRPDIDLVAVPYPKGEDGKAYHPEDSVIRRVRSGAIITSSCEHVEEAVRLLDYLYSPEGADLINWGIEGESYTKENGEYKFTDKILNNPDGKVPREALCEYITNTGFVGLEMNAAARALESNLQGKTQETRNASIKYAQEADKSMLTYITPMTAEETSEFSALQTDISTFVDENVSKFILGLKSMSEYDEFVEQAKSMGLERAVEIYQTADERMDDK